jgi:hypothetical protein
MHTLSLEQALSLWSDLEQAYYKPEKYRTVEIYMYRLVSGSPSANRVDLIEDPGLIGDNVREVYQKANRALYALLKHFCKTREASIKVDGREIGPWVAESLQCHRVQVTVDPIG